MRASGKNGWFGLLEREVTWPFRPIALCLAVPLVGACSSSGNSTHVGTSSEAVSVGTATCEYSVATDVHGVGAKGFNAHVTVTNVSGATSTGFSVLVNAGAAQLVNVAHGSFTPSEYGYLLSADASLANSQLNQGQTYTFELKFSGAYTQLSAEIISNDGVTCDQTPPTVSMTSSGTFFTSNGTLTLSAQANDDVGVGKVVFAQDGVTIASVYSPPYSVSVPVTGALNGRRVYTATAYDLSGNQASQSQRVLVDIGNKFFGTAVTTAADYPGLLAHFNQVTPGNAGKWGSVEAVRGQMNWTDLDTAYNFAKANNIPFKLHTLVWGSQQPAWIDGLAPADQLAAVDNWMAAVAARYPAIDMIDVVNEPMHTPPSYAAALGGAGATGWDWVITAFQMARQHFPNAELLVNDYSVLPLTSFTQEYLTIVNLLNDRGLIDGIGEQGHFYERSPDLSTLTTNLNALTATGLPLYITELDLNLSNDAQQAQRMSQLFPIFWSNPSVVGVTHWGYLQGNMWQPDAYLIRTDGSLRPSLTWLECYKAGGTNCPVPTYVPQPRVGNNTGISIAAVNYDAANGLLALGNVVAYANDGSWLAYDQVSFNSNWNKLNVTYALGSTSPISLSLSLGSLSNAPVATVPLAPTGSWGTNATVSIPWPSVSTVQDLYVQFHGGGANLQTFQFTGPTPARNIVSNGTFESGTSGWYTYSGGVLSASTARAHSGTQSLLVANRTSNAPAATNITSAVTPGSSYPFTVWASINSADGSSKSIHVTQATTCQGGGTSYTWIANPITIPSNTTWTQFSGTVTIPNCTLSSIVFYLEGDTGADLYVDDVQILDTSGAPVNLITDGTFESGKGSWYGWNESSLAVTNTAAHGGSQSLEAVGISNGAIARDIKSLVTAGKKYQATAWVSVSNLASGSGSVNWQTVQNCNTGGSDTYPWLAGATVNNGAWVQVSGVVDLTSCTTINGLQLYAGAASGNLYIDDVSLTALP
jgi:GH35 family endo-1,4-beta-xylanase